MRAAAALQHAESNPAARPGDGSPAACSGDLGALARREWPVAIPPLPSPLLRRDPAHEASPGRTCREADSEDHGQRRTSGWAALAAQVLPARARDLLCDQRVRANRAKRFALRDALRDVQAGKRARDCGHRVVGMGVEVVSDDGGRCSYRQVLQCDNVWGCFVCQGRILARYAADLTAAVEQHGISRTLLGSFTTRHFWPDDLKWLRQKQALCFRKLLGSKTWRLFRERFGIVGIVRSSEVTFGWINGFHAHLHPLFFMNENRYEQGARREIDALNEALFRVWCGIVRRVMGEKYVPDEKHGIVLTPCYRADYVVKMGVSLEVTGSFSKKGKNGNISMLEVATRAAAGDKRYCEVFRRYTHGMKGAKLLTWDKGAKEILDRARQPQRDQPDGAKDESGRRLVARLPLGLWRELRVIPGAKVTILERGEDGGIEAIRAYVGQALGPEHAHRVSAERASLRPLHKTLARHVEAAERRILELDYRGKREAPP